MSQEQNTDRISALAFQYYEDEGRPEGKAEEHWERAVKTLNAEGAAVGEAQPPPESSDEDLR